jgi:hypothetical protein
VKRLAAFLLLSLAACGGHPGMDASLAWRGPAEDEHMLREAVDEWNAVCGFHLSVTPDGDVPVYYNPHLDAATQQATTRMNSGAMGVTSIEYRYPANRALFAHELEHLMGVDEGGVDGRGHVEGREHLMYFANQPANHVEEEDCARVREANR